MTSDLDGQWLLVEAMGEEPTVIGLGARPREMRRLSNMFRGAARSALGSLVQETIAKKTKTTMVVPDSAAEQLGGPFGVATPTVGPDGTVVAMQLWVGRADAPPPPPEILGVWEWELGLENRPPRLQLTAAALDLMGIDPKFRDRSVFGPADYFTRVEKLSELVDLDTKIKNAAVGDESSGTIIIRPDGNGALRRLQYAQRCVSTPAGPRLRGVCRAIEWDDDAQQHIDLLDGCLLDAVLGVTGVYAVIGDVTYPTAPYVMKWLTPHPPDAGHGVSTGQTPGIHPDDMGKVIGWIHEIRTTGRPVSGRARTRAAGGGWMEGSFTGVLLDPKVSTTIIAGIVYPDSIRTEAPDTSR